MRVRFLSRTHYQADELGYVQRLISDCTSPTHGEYSEKVAGRLAKLLSSDRHSFNIAAARYVLDLARGLGVINENCVWSETGLLVKMFSHHDSDLIDRELTLEERLVFFRLFLDADGAAYLYIAKYISDHGRIPVTGQAWPAFANDMAIGIYSEYLSVITDTLDRVKLRQALEKRQKTPFVGKSGAHQSFVHLQSMYRLGLLDRNSGTSRLYLPAKGLPNACPQIRNCLPDITVLEETNKNRQWFEIAAELFDIASNGGSQEADISHEEFRDLFSLFYNKVSALGVSLCPLDTLFSAIQIQLVSTRRYPIPVKYALRLLRQFEQSSRGSLSLHVDRYGRPAFARLSGELVLP